MHIKLSSIDFLYTILHVIDSFSSFIWRRFRQAITKALQVDRQSLSQVRFYKKSLAQVANIAFPVALKYGFAQYTAMPAENVAFTLVI